MSRRTIRYAWIGAIWAGITIAPAEVWASQDGKWAQALFSESGHDFGPVPRGAIVRHKFILTNRLQEAINILDVRASCGCTSGFASVGTVPPGQQAYIEAQMDTRNFTGMKATTLTVTLMTASGHQAEARFGVQSNILADIVLNPGSIEFGSIAKGSTPTQELTIERLGAPSWRTVRMVSTSRSLSAQLVETMRSEAGVGYKLTVSLKPDAPPGLLREEIRILTNDSTSPSVPVLVTAQVQGTLQATPEMLTLGNVPNAAASQGRYVVRGTTPFTITGIEGEGDGFQVVEAGPGKKTLHVLTLSFNPPPADFGVICADRSASSPTCPASPLWSSTRRCTSSLEKIRSVVQTARACRSAGRPSRFGALSEPATEVYLGVAFAFTS